MWKRCLLPSLLACLCSLICSCGSRIAKSPAEHTRRILYYHDPMHPAYHSDAPGIAPDCNMQLTPVYADDAVSKPGDRETSPAVRVNAEQAAAIGLQTEIVREEAGSGEIRTVGRVEVPESRRYVVTAGADGWIRRIHGGESGARVTKGQPLASYYSRDVSSPQQAYLYALDAEQRLASTAVPTQKDLAARQLAQAHDYLEFIGLTPSQISALARSRQEAPEVTLGAPASGIVLERNVFEGARFNHGDVLWRIGEIDSVSVIAELFVEDMASFSGARTATVILPGGSQLPAIVDPSPPRFDPSARAGNLRLTVKNRDGSLLPGMNVTVVLPRRSVDGLFIPLEAVIEAGIKPRVFVRRNDGSLEARTVATGVRSGARQQILSGLRSGEEVVTSGAFLIDSESRLP